MPYKIYGLIILLKQEEVIKFNCRYIHTNYVYANKNSLISYSNKLLLHSLIFLNLLDYILLFVPSTVVNDKDILFLIFFLLIFDSKENTKFFKGHDNKLFEQNICSKVNVNL